MKIPKTIYLQRYDDEDNLLDIGYWTWCQDKINDTDLEYILNEESVPVPDQNIDFYAMFEKEEANVSERR